MKAIMVMFDTLRRKSLPAYGNDWMQLPNFKRLEEKTVVFDNFFAGSLPCMPARRELHTGRYNFLHRSWGPLEPFDDSSIEQLKNNNIYCHITTDHAHYLEDGGATYHNRYNTWECFRGQEGDRWKSHMRLPEIPKQHSSVKSGISFRQNWVNRAQQTTEEEMSSYKTFQAGLEFMEKNKNQDNWFLQIECFDPHEPFFVPERFKDLYKHNYKGDYIDWPSYRPYDDQQVIEHVNYEYAALLSMCDEYLGKILDYMDENAMWDDTMLIVNTDHGLLLGEHEWCGKNVQPFYNEIVHLPFYLWNPKQKVKKERRSGLVQTIDIAPTLLEYFEVEIPEIMQGKPLQKVLEVDQSLHQEALFGMHGGHVNVTDGKYIYMRAPITKENQPLFEYTMMPTHMRNFFDAKALNKATLVKPSFLNDETQVLKVPTKAFLDVFQYGNKLYDMENDPEQNTLIEDIDLEIQMIDKLRKGMIDSGATDEQYMRLGIEKDRALTKEEVLEQRRMRNKV